MTSSSKLLNLSAAILAAILLPSCESENVPPIKQNLESGTIMTIAGQGPSNSGHEGDGGPASLAKLSWIVGITVDHNDNLYFTDGASNTVHRINASDSIITTIAGKFVGFNNAMPYQGDGGSPLEANLNIPLTVAVNSLSDVIFTDNGANIILKVATSSGTISTMAGTGAQGFQGDGGPANLAQLSNSQGVVFDKAGNLYFADTQNNVIRKVDANTGIITTITGQGPDQPGYSGDNGPAIDAKISSPRGLAIDKDDNLYFSDRGNNVIRKIAVGTISTIAGNGIIDNSGDGGPALSASIFAVNGVAVDLNDNVYITSAHAIRKIDQTTGIISTFAGNGTAGYSGDGGPATAAQINAPWGVTVDSRGNVYFTDTFNAVIRVVIK